MTDFNDFKKTKADGFETYCFKVYPELSKAYSITIKQIEDNPVLIENQLELLTIHYPRVKEIESMFDMFLDIAEYQKLTKRGENMTDVDRKMKLKYDVAEERVVRDKAAGLSKTMGKRISVLQSRLKSAREERNRTGR